MKDPAFWICVIFLTVVGCVVGIALFGGIAGIKQDKGENVNVNSYLIAGGIIGTIIGAICGAALGDYITEH